MKVLKFTLPERGVQLAIAHWFWSRVAIAIALLVIAPALPTPADGLPVPWGWDVFNRWDGRQYEQIARFGYEFVNDGRAYNVAFFPFFPLLLRLAIALNFNPVAVGAIANNLAFFAATLLLYRWVEERYHPKTANWVTAAFVWCPFSLFGSVLYTEGCFLLFAIASLHSFEHKKYRQTAFWGALATATRLPGLALIPTFFVVAWLEKRPLRAYWAALATATGFLLYLLYCGWRFGEPLAFYLSQRGWSPPNAWEQSWLLMLLQVVLGPANAGREGVGLVDWGYPLGIAAIALLGIALWRARPTLGNARTDYLLGVLGLIFWAIAGSPLVNFLTVWGGAYLIWRSRHRLTPTMLAYATFSFLIILAAQRTASAERYAYGIAPLSIVLGLLLERYPRFGYMTLAFLGILLLSGSVRFAQNLWAG